MSYNLFIVLTTKYFDPHRRPSEQCLAVHGGAGRSMAVHKLVRMGSVPAVAQARWAGPMGSGGMGMERTVLCTYVRNKK